MTLNLTETTLGPYQLGDLIGEGGLAAVYRAYQPSLERWVAVKVLHSEDTSLLARFEREAKTVAQLHHPNILPVYEYGVQDGQAYIVMQLIEQGTLAQLLTDRPLDGIQAAKLAIPIAEALDYAHQRGLIHRDVKPTNILMPREDWPLLADFGLVKVQTTDQSLTQSDVTIGTPSYISPEQVNGATLDARADMYALGVMLFEMVTGRLPFDYKNINSLMLAHVSEPPPIPRDLNPRCPLELQKIILTALRKKPAERYPTMQTMIQALKTFVANRTTSPLATTDLDKAAAVATPLPALTQTQTVPNEAHPPAQMPQLLIRPHNLTVDLMPPPGQDDLIIGRAGEASPVDVDLTAYGATETGISRRHARLARRQGKWLLNDLDSTNGTFVNNIKLFPGMMMRLKNGDELRFGLLECIFLIASE